MSVNGTKITRAEWAAENARTREFFARVYGIDLRDDQARQVLMQIEQTNLQQLVDRALLHRAAIRADIRVSRAEVDARVERDVAQNGGIRELQRILNTQGLTLDQYRKKVQEMILIEKLWNRLTGSVQVSEEEIRQAFAAQKEQWNSPAKVKVGHILVNSESLALSIIDKLDRGADFRQLALKYSRDPSVRQNQGVLGYIAEDDPHFPEAIRKEAFSLQPGTYSRKPVKSEFGYHVLFIFDKKMPVKVKYEEVRELIKNSVLDKKKNEAFLSFLKRLRHNSRIMYNLKYINSNYLEI